MEGTFETHNVRLFLSHLFVHDYSTQAGRFKESDFEKYKIIFITFLN